MRGVLRVCAGSQYQQGGVSDRRRGGVAGADYIERYRGGGSVQSRTRRWGSLHDDGDLTIKGVTRPVTLDLVLLGEVQ